MDMSLPWTIPEWPGYLLLAFAAATFIVAGIVKGQLGVAVGLSEMVCSAIALLPMALGMSIGRRLRGLLSEGAFRNVLLGFLSTLALLLIGKGV